MSRYKLRRCSVCGKFHASYLVPDGKGGSLHYCYSCWKAWQASQPPAAAGEKGEPHARQAEVDKESK